MILKTEKYNRLELFARRTGGEHGKITLKQGRADIAEITVRLAVYEFYALDMQKDGVYEIEFENADINYAYLCGNDDVMETGVGFVEFDAEMNMVREVMLADYHNTAIKEQYHFIPMKNWLNDPNGLCWFQGYYHMFYQANPVNQMAEYCYWGHAVSIDMVNWKYLPIAIFPQKHLLEDPGTRGGAFSGSALVKDRIMHLFFTRHEGRKDQLQSFLEYQVKADCRDGIHVIHERELIRQKPEDGMSCDFRDPKVTEIDGKNRMVIAGSKDHRAVLFSYSSEDLEKWHYDGIILKDPEEGIVSYECPDLFQLEGKDVAVAALMDYVDGNGHFRPTRYYIGNIVDGTFISESTGYMDFGLNYYAAQSFVHQNRRFVVGWVADFLNEHVFLTNGCNGSMSIPRELSLVNGRLYMKPVKEIYNLIGKEMEITSIEGKRFCTIAGNSYFVSLELSENADIEMELLRNEVGNLRFKWYAGKAEIISTNDQNARYVAAVPDIRKVEIFVDRRMAEVFINDGEAVGTRIFYTMNQTGYFELSSSQEYSITRLQIYSMNTIW